MFYKCILCANPVQVFDECALGCPILGVHKVRQIGDDLGLLPCGIVLHLTVNHGDTRSVRHRFEDAAGEGHFIRIGREDFLGNGDLTGMQAPCARAAEQEGVAKLLRPLVRPHYTGTLTTVAFPPFFPIVCCNPMRDCGVVDVRRFDLPKRKRPSMILAVLRDNPFIT